MTVRRLCFAVALALASSSIAAGGEKLNFNPDWKFIKADPPGAAAPEFDDSGWANVSVPHTFNDVDTFDDWSTPGHVGEMNLWSGRTWYRKTFTVPDSFKGKKVYIEFEAVRQVAEVYLNGTLLGTSKTGFIPFGFDLSPRLRFGGAKNVIAVMADNSFTKETDMARIVASELPWNSPHWHPAHGGIYRNVYLHVTDPLHIPLPLYSFLQTAGPYVYATGVSANSAEVHVDIPVENQRRGNQMVEVRAAVLDRAGQLVLELKQSGAIAAGASAEFKLAGTLTKPQPWEPAYPFLYKVVCFVTSGGKPVDSMEVPFGIRTARWDAQEGFFINGHHVKLHGWGQKPTDEWPGLGAAQPDWMHFFTLQLMKDAGANFVRWGHCAGGPASIAAGDRLGIIADQPGVDGEGDTDVAWNIRAAAFRDTIIYFRNNPSILIWEGGNQKVKREHAEELRTYMRRYDPYGGRAYAHRRADEITAEFMDIGIGTEGGREIGRLPVVEGEYNREESPRRVWDDFSPPNFGYPEAKGQTYQLTSEQYAVNQISQFVKKLGAAFHSGGANWIFSDSTSGGRVSTEVARTGGEVDGVRLPKEAYYVCRTMFRNDPQVHIVGHWTYPAGTKKTIYVASNAEEVELSLNGQSLGRAKPALTYLFTFPDVTWQPGELKAVAYSGGKLVATQSKRTAGQPVGLRMTPIMPPGGLRADGSDVLLMDVEAIDASGERCPTVQQRVDFSAEGAAVWRGGYNSGKIRSINNTYLVLEAGINRVALRATRNAGRITVRATAEKLNSATVIIESSPFKTENGFSSVLPAFPEPQLPQRPQQPVVTSQPAPGPQTIAAAQPQQRAGRFIGALSYSGPTTAVHVEPNASDGKRVYVDSDVRFEALPPALRGFEYVQAAKADRSYSAVDLMEVAINTQTTVFIAHDDRLPRPAWLVRSYKAAGFRISVGGRPMAVFTPRTPEAGSLTLGSNADQAVPADANMYIVFVGPAG